ncbi:hypothetical protein A2U01_0095304, partial [Trifolium medium]|nr:hypothetical protein [Trifolium medium]
VVHESIYRSHTGQTVMTPPKFFTHVAWPGVRPTFPGGSGAGAADDDAEMGFAADDDAVDEAAADAAEDDEDDQMSD